MEQAHDRVQWPNSLSLYLNLRFMLSWCESVLRLTHSYPLHPETASHRLKLATHYLICIGLYKNGQFNG